MSVLRFGIHPTRADLPLLAIGLVLATSRHGVLRIRSRFVNSKTHQFYLCVQQNRSDPDDEVMVSSLFVRNKHLYSGYSGRVAVWDIVGGREVAVWTKQKEIVHLMVVKKNRLYTWFVLALALSEYYSAYHLQHLSLSLLSLCDCCGSSWDDTICIYDINADPVNPPLIAQTKIKTNYGNAEGLAIDDENISNPIFYWTAQSMLCVRALKGQPKPKIYACTSSGMDSSVLRLEKALILSDLLSMVFRIRLGQVDHLGR